jgi:hypothetical protein
MKALIITLFALLALVYSQNLGPTWAPYTAWTADFICTAPQFGTGFFRGKVKFDWSVRAFSLVFDGPEAYSEFYQFNTDRGYKTDATTGSQFSFQYLYKSSKSCPCETTGLNFAMPPFFSGSEKMNAISGISYLTNEISNDGGLGTSVPSASRFSSNPLFTYTQAGQPKSYTLFSFFWQRGTVPAGFNINDFQRRTFALTNVVEGSPNGLGLVAPKSGCKCGKQMDIVLSLDRSGSISRDQWGLEYQFTKNIVNSFTYGPLATNIGIGNWNAVQWKTIEITSGTSDAVVQSAVNSMGCCPGTSTTQCCCCGTPIGGGIRLGGEMLAKSTRGKAQKVLILLTDGCQNHIWDPIANKATPCGCSSEKACATNFTCVNDITVNYNWVEQNLPGTRIIVVGVGTADTICKDQLTLAAGGDSLNVYTPQNWDQLLTLVETITATACTADNALCPGCCGICTCGQCLPPTDCLNPDACNNGTLVDGCCTTKALTCPKQPCKFEYCDAKQGCLYDPIECPPDETCVKYTCNNSYVCEGSKKYNTDGSEIPACTTVVVYKCVNDSQCDDKSVCTKDTCQNHECVNTYIPCDPDDKCVSWTCFPKTGCQASRITCNDKSNCTADRCDPKEGCKFDPVPCPPAKTKCEYVICDAKQGCLVLPKDCRDDGFVPGNCTVPACNETCYNQYICTAPPPTSEETFPETVVLVSTLTTAAVAGIVIAAVLLAAGLGGGAAVAIVQAAGAGGAVVTASNPLYAGAGIGGDNPLNQG